MTRTGCLAVLSVSLTAAVARAEPPGDRGPVASPAARIDVAPPAQVVSVPLWSLQQGQGIAVEYDRELPWPHLSVAGVAGVRDAADGDFQSIRTSLGGELRYWWRARELRGWYGGVAVDLARSRVTDRIDDRQVGSTFTIAESLSAGYRWVPWRRFEVTPSIGFAVIHEIDLDGRLPTWHRRTVTGGMTLGWMF